MLVFLFCFNPMNTLCTSLFLHFFSHRGEILSKLVQLRGSSGAFHSTIWSPSVDGEMLFTFPYFCPWFETTLCSVLSLKTRQINLLVHVGDALEYVYTMSWFLIISLFFNVFHSFPLALMPLFQKNCISTTGIGCVWEQAADRWWYADAEIDKTNKAKISSSSRKQQRASKWKKWMQKFSVARR